MDALRRTEEAISAALGSVQQAHARVSGRRRQHGRARSARCSTARVSPEIHFEDDAPLDEEVN